jgi:tetratricopeptide (TPR) repeat protein
MSRRPRANHRAVRQRAGIALAFILALCLAAEADEASVGGCGVANTGEMTVGGDIDIVCNTPADQLESLVRLRAKPLEEQAEAQKKLIVQLEKELELNERQMRAALDTTGEVEVPPEQIAAKLVEIAGRYKAFRKEVQPAAGDDTQIAELKVQASEAIEQGELEEAGALLFDDYYNRGGMYRKKNRHDMAIINYEKALDSINLAQIPDHFGVHYNLADSYRKLGNVNKSIDQFRKSIKLKPSNPEANYNLANMYQQNGERDLAKNCYQRVIELTPKGSDLQNKAEKNLLLLGGKAVGNCQ